MKFKPRLKYRAKCHITGAPVRRYLVIDPSYTTFHIPIVVLPTSEDKPHEVWFAGPGVKRFDTLQMAMAYAVAWLEAQVIERREQIAAKYA